jgi:signal transduction histidine kinase
MGRMRTRDRSNARAEPVWISSVVGWHLAFWLFLGLVLVSAFIEDMRPRDRLAFIAVLAVLGLAYLLFGQPAARSRDRLRSHVYRIVLVVCCGLSAALFRESMFLLFIAFPQIWFLSERVREGVIFSVLVLVADATGLFYAMGWSWSEFAYTIPWLLVSLTISLVLGIWIERVVAQSEQRAELIAELDSTRGELAEANHAAGAMAERERMAREIHDTLAQGMTSIVMLSQAAQAGLAHGGTTDDARAKLAAIEDTARENLAEARALVAAFTPVALTDSPLPEVLRRQAERFSAETGIDVSVELDLPEDESAALSPGQQVVLLRSAQEALANVRKHAAATRVQIRLTGTGGGTAIEIRDDGQGFETAAPSTGYGLAAMRGRVEESGGTVEVDSSPGHGTRVHVLVPVEGT